ncbi:phosphate/phosphite/phosphonate ABC transporter substrate-binding protein [Marinobacter lacisalsi]|uniref:Phosphate/phosphite/phosphonate ABC transporter substrate-binding protein n=1 Tax=Marinobacter lacisalsi TaxID=475979 RepID=A0ABV8QC17_9GAMM
MTIWKNLLRNTTFALITLLSLATTAQAETVRLAVTDLVGLEELQREFGTFRDTLEKATGYEIEFLPVTNRTAAVEALRFEKVDFVLTGPAEYVVMQKRADARVVVGFSRPDYFAVVITLADSPYTSVADLNGQKVGLGSVGSTSKHLGPIQTLADAGANPLEDMDIIHTKVPVMWEGLKRGDLAAIGMNHINFLNLRDQELKAGGMQPGAFRVIARGPDLPNDVLMAGAHVDQAVIDQMRDAITTNSDELVDAILKGEDNQKYSGMRFIANIEDSHYDYVRAMYATAGFPEYSDFIGD